MSNDWPLKQVISGGQSGVDQAALAAAAALGYRTGGMMPRDYRTETGPRPDLAIRYGLTISRAANYQTRTRWNANRSTGTVIIIDRTLDGGSLTTAELCNAYGRPYDVVRLSGVDADLVGQIRRFIVRCEIRILNVAGHRESRAPGIYDRVHALLLEALRT